MAWSVCQKMLTREKSENKFKIKVQVQTQESSSRPTGLLDCWSFGLLEFGVWCLVFGVWCLCQSGKWKANKLKLEFVVWNLELRTNVVLDCARTDNWILSFGVWGLEP